MVATPDFHIICIGKLKNRHCAALTEEFISRLRHDARLTVSEMRDSSRQQEGREIIARLNKTNGYIFALTEEGMQFDSLTFAKTIEKIPRQIIFIIGGPDGLTVDVKKRADRLLSLSTFTFTHEFARVVLAEQLYRSCSILRNRPYHRK